MSTTLSSPRILLQGLVRPNSDVRVPETQEGLSHQDTPSPRRQFDVNDTVFAKNYAAGPNRLPGVVVGLQGSVMYRIRLRDNREIVRHVDQLRARVDSGVSPSSPEGSEGVPWNLGGPDRTEELIEDTSQATEQNESSESPQASATEVRLDPTVSSNDASSPTSKAQTEPSEGTVLRRSGRARHPPERFEEHSFVVCA